MPLAPPIGPWVRWKRDLVGIPGLLSLARLPLAGLFVVVARTPRLAFAVLVASAVTDVLDGWYARRFRQTSATGTVLDPIADKVFVLVVLVTLLEQRNLSITSAMLLCTREALELPLVLYVAARHKGVHAETEPPLANAAGKLATGLQFATIAFAICRSPATPRLVVATALAGAAAGVTYWVRALSRSPRRAAPRQ